MIFENTYNISDVLTAVSVFVVIIGGVFSLIQWMKNQQLKRGEYINELTEKIRTDEDIKEIVYLMDYNDEIWYTAKFHGSGEFERKVDKTLSYFAYICYLKKKRLITASEFEFFEYEIRRILMNHQVVEYLYNLYHFSDKHKMHFTFYYLFLYGKRKTYYISSMKKHIRFFDKEFFNPKSNSYPHYLNF